MAKTGHPDRLKVAGEVNFAGALVVKATPGWAVRHASAVGQFLLGPERTKKWKPCHHCH